MRRIKPRRPPPPPTPTLSEGEAFQVLDGVVDPRLKELMWEFSPEMVVLAIQRLDGSRDPDEIKRLLESNRQLVQEKTQESLSKEDVGEKIKAGFGKHLKIK